MHGVSVCARRPGRSEEGIGSLDLELQVVEGGHAGARNQTQSPGRETLNYWVTSLAPIYLLYVYILR